MIVDTIPIDAYSWTIGAIVLFFVGVRGLMSYREKPNPLSQMLMVTGLMAGTALTLYGVPLFFIDNARSIEWMYFVADVLILSLMAGCIYYVWLLMLSKRIPLYLIAIPVGLLAGLAIFTTIPEAESSFTLVDGSLGSGQISPYFGVLATILVALGAYFARLLLAAKHGTTRARLAGFTILYGGIGIAIVLDGVVLRSSEDGPFLALAIAAMVLLFGAWFFVLGRKK